MGYKFIANENIHNTCALKSLSLSAVKQKIAQCKRNHKRTSHILYKIMTIQRRD